MPPGPVSIPVTVEVEGHGNHSKPGSTKSGVKNSTGHSKTQKSTKKPQENPAVSHDATVLTVSAEVYDSVDKGRQLNQDSLKHSTKHSRSNPAVSHTELEIHAPEGDFDEEVTEESGKSVPTGKSGALFSSEQMKFLGSFLKDMLQSVLKPASAQDTINTTLTKISMVKTPKVTKDNESHPPPVKKRRLETVAHNTIQEDSEDESDYQEKNHESSGEDNENDDYEDEDDRDEEDDDGEEDRQKCAIKKMKLI